jgi:nucleotide-binding universal stress UspA family protein
MRDLRSILYVFDDEPGAARAFVRAVDLAARTETRLTVAHCIEGDETAEADADTDAEWEARLRALVDGRDVAGLTVETRVLRGEAGDAIIEEVRRHGHDLVMKTASPDTEGVALLFGNLDGRLLRECPAAVLIDRPNGRPNIGPILAAVDPGDEKSPGLAHRVMEMATELAACERSELHVVHAWRIAGELAMRGRAFSDAAEQEVDEEVQKERAVHAAALDALLAPFRDGCQGLHEHLVKGGPQVVIPDLVQAEGIDLVVIGTAARHGLTGLIVGNTAEGILGSVTCGILAVKPKGFGGDTGAA